MDFVQRYFVSDFKEENACEYCAETCCNKHVWD